ncbi:MAG: PAS domain S-box protein [Proteobacteria bacterium]|nr:PAS domain S-box protein [Pseudomonadota bacterium]
MLDFLHLVISPPKSSVLYTGSYDAALISLSIFIAILASYASLLAAQHIPTVAIAKARRMGIAGGGICFGFGTWAIHYSGMAAMNLNGLIRYDIKLFLLPILAAIILATLALWIKFRLKSLQTRRNTNVTIISAVVMGLAVSGMHSAMAAAYLVRDGDAAVDSSGITPAFLASIVLVASSLIIVITLIATYCRKHSEFSIARFYKLPSLLLIGWIVVSWLSADYYYNHLADELFQHESQHTAQEVENITSNITESLKLLKGASQVLAHDADTIKVLRGFGANVAPSALTYQQRKQRWSHTKALQDLNNSLNFASTNLGADLIWVVNAAGDCIASGNANESVSIVGLNLADRKYFQQARAGQQGYQYAVGRATNVPGLYYSSPVFESGHFLGAVVVKRDVSKLAFWTKQENVCIADANGVIVMAPDKQYELRYMPNAPVANLSVKDKTLLYKRSKLEPLKLTPWGSIPSVVLIEDKFPPVVFASKILAENAITIYVHSSLNDLVRFGTEKYWLFFMLATTGSMLIVAVSAVVIFLRESQKMNTRLRIAACAFESDEGIIVTNASNVILRVNQAFTAITGYTAEEAIGQTPRMLSSGRYDAEFFATMWRCLDKSGTWEGDLWNRRRGGDEYPEHLIITAVKDKNGFVTNYVATFSDIATRIQTEIALQKSHQQMYSLLNSMAEGAYGVDINGNCTFVNRAFLRILGYENIDEVIGRHIHTLIHHSHPDGSCYPALECKMYQAYRRNQEIHVSDEVFWTKKGVAIPVEYWSQPILIDNIMQGAIATFIDVTERKQAEILLKSTKDYAENLINTANAMVVELDVNGNVKLINPAAEMITGYSMLELKGRNWFEIIVPRDRYPAVWKMFEGLPAGELLKHFENLILTKSGEERYIVWQNSELREDNKITGLVTFGIDITERKQLEDALKESELRYRTVADFTSDWEYWILPDNTFRYISPACEQISGYTPDEFYADPSLLTQVVHPDDLPLYVGHIHHVSEQGVSEPIDFRIRTKSGEIRWISHVCRPVYDAAGHYLGQRAGNRDISDRRAAEEQIRSLAFYDTLTLLPNRRLLNDRLGQTMAASRRNGHYGALMFLDLDNFKPLNDQHGHGVGDLLLIEVAHRISRCVREIDTVSRFGGDEFVVMLSRLDVDKAESTLQAGIIAEKIRVLLAEPYILTIRQEGQAESAVEHRCTSSIGVVLFNHKAGMEDIFKWADIAMYQAKADGRNLIRFFDSKISSVASAIDQDAMALHLNWHESYDCGEPVIDQAHRKLFELANTLIETAFVRKEYPQRFDSALEKLLAHVVQHFNDEEAILARHHYAGFDEHVRAHKVLVDHALQLRSDAAAGGVTIGELVNFLADEVVAQHMLREDRKFFPLFNEFRPS